MDDEKKGKKMSSEQGNLLLEVWVLFCTKFKIKTIHTILRWIGLKNSSLGQWNVSFYYHNNQGLPKAMYFFLKAEIST